MSVETEPLAHSVGEDFPVQYGATGEVVGSFSEFSNATLTPQVWENIAFLDKLVECSVLPARYRLKLSDTDWQLHREDLAQTALETFFEFSHQPFEYILGIIRHRLTDYALINIYGRQAGHNSRYAKGYFIHTVEQPEMDLDAYLHGFKPLHQTLRPVENALINRESQPEREQYWFQVEREFMAIMVATGGGKSRPDRLRRYTEVLIKRLQGKTNSAIALEMALPLEEIIGILERARQRIREFEALSSLMRGLVWAWGHLNVYWPDEITTELLNGGRKFVAILPHGEFNVSYSEQRCYVQTGLKVNGKVRTRQVTLGELGSLTYPQLHQATLELKQKVTGLSAKRENEA